MTSTVWSGTRTGSTQTNGDCRRWRLHTTFAGRNQTLSARNPTLRSMFAGSVAPILRLWPLPHEQNRKQANRAEVALAIERKTATCSRSDRGRPEERNDPRANQYQAQIRTSPVGGGRGLWAGRPGYQPRAISPVAATGRAVPLPGELTMARSGPGPLP